MAFNWIFNNIRLFPYIISISYKQNLNCSCPSVKLFHVNSTRVSHLCCYCCCYYYCVINNIFFKCNPTHRIFFCILLQPFLVANFQTTISKFWPINNWQLIFFSWILEKDTLAACFIKKIALNIELTTNTASSLWNSGCWFMESWQYLWLSQCLFLAKKICCQLSTGQYLKIVFGYKWRWRNV